MYTPVTHANPSHHLEDLESQLVVTMLTLIEDYGSLGLAAIDRAWHQVQTGEASRKHEAELYRIAM